MATESNSYWAQSRDYYETSQKLHEALVPVQGSADTLEGEVLRVAQNIYYDFYNNGGCNLSNDGIIDRDLNERFGFDTLRAALSQDTYVKLVCLAERASIENVFEEEGWAAENDEGQPVWSLGTFLDEVIDEVIDWIKGRKPELFLVESKENRIDRTAISVLEDAKASYPVVLHEKADDSFSKAVVRIQAKTPAAKELAIKIADFIREDHEAYQHFLTILGKD